MADTTSIGYVPVDKAGDTMTGDLILNADPSSALQAATKQYVDSLTLEGDFKEAAKVATTANLTATYDNGASGVGATLTNSGAMAALSIDGVALALNDRVLVKDQSSLPENGIYYVSVVGDGATNWVLVRATDFDEAADMTAGAALVVYAGTANASTGWLLASDITTIGTDNITFSQLTAPPTASANTALSNLAAVAINESLTSDTDITDDLGTAAIRWQNAYLQSARSGDTATDTFTFDVYDTGGASYTNFMTATVGNPATVNFYNIDSITINGQSAPAHSEGMLFYDSDEKALSYYNDASDVTVNLGQENIIRVYNNSGAQINNGKVVYANGAAGAENRPSIVEALADDASTAQVLGVATHDIANGSYGYVTQFGLVHDLNTASFTAGDYVYLSASSTGDLVNTAPTSPNLNVLIGQVLVSDASVGVVFVTALGNTGLSAAGAGSATQLVVNARKDSAGTINDGEAVYITGYNAGQDVILVELAQSNSSATMPAIGLAQGSFTNSTTGEVILSGRIANQDTSSWSVGDQLYVDPSTPGALTSTKPVANNLIQKVGTVTRSNVTNGVITITGAGRSNDIPNFTAADKYWYGGTGGVATEGDITTFGQTLVGLTGTNNNIVATNGSGVPALGTALPDGITATTQTITDATTKVATDAFVDSRVKLGQTDIACSSNTTYTPSINTNHYYKLTFTSSCTLAFTFNSGSAQSMCVELINAGGYTITWPASLEWAGGTEPTWTTTGRDIIVVWNNGDNLVSAALIGQDFS